MNGGLDRADDDGFDSTVFARPQPTTSRGSQPLLPWIFEPFFSTSRTTIAPTSTAKPVPISTSKSPVSTRPPPTTAAPAPSETRSPSKEPESSAEQSSKLGSSSDAPSSRSTSEVILSSASVTSTPSTLETTTTSNINSASLIELQPSVASLSTLEPIEPLETSTSRQPPNQSGVIPPPPASHTGDASSQSNTDGGQRTSKASGGTIGGIVGGLSGAILVGVLLFFCWKWRTRGRYRFKNRCSFDPYGNGIDANRGGLLVSSVACKPSDQSSGKETLYSDDQSPTRYQHAEQQAGINREPTIPILKEPPKPRTYSNSPPASRPQREQTKEPFPPFAPDMSMPGPIQQPVRSHQGQPRPYPLLYERRRPPVPPSMRRNRSPPDRVYGEYPPKHNPVLSEPIPGIYAIESSGLGFAGPYPQNSNIMRSNSIGAHRPPRGYPNMTQLDRNRRIRRSNSMNSLQHRSFASQNIHPAMRGGPSSMNRPNGAYHRPTRSIPPSQDPRAHAYYDQPQSHQIRRNLTVRNPTPAYSGAEKLTAPTRKPLSEMVRRATSKHKTDDDDDDEQPRQKPKHAAKNF